MTVSEMSSRLGNFLNDPNENVFTSSLKIDALNNAQIEVVNTIMAAGSKESHIFDILGEIQEEYTFSNITSTGALLSSITSRYFLRNGFINGYIVDDSGTQRWVSRITSDRLGMQENMYFKGTTESPTINFTRNRIFLTIDAVSYPKDLVLTFIGKPYTLGTAASGSGKDKVVTTCELNITLHDVIVLIAQNALLTMRGQERDLVETAGVEKRVNRLLSFVIRGGKVEPQDKTMNK